MKFFNFALALAVLQTANIASASLLPGTEGDGISSLVYDPATGNLSIQAEGGNLAFLSINSASGAFTGDSVIVPTGALPTDNDTTIGFAVFSGSFAAEGSVLDLGNILPSGLEFDFLQQDLTGAVNFDPPLQSGNVPLDIILPSVGGGVTLDPAAGEVFELSFGAPELLDAITATGGTITDASFDGGPEDRFFTIDFDDDSVSLGLDLSANFSVLSNPINAPFTVTTSDGETFGFSVTAAVPEPTTLGLIGLAMVGFAARRRQG